MRSLLPGSATGPQGATAYSPSQAVEALAILLQTSLQSLVEGHEGETGSVRSNPVLLGGGRPTDQRTR